MQEGFQIKKGLSSNLFDKDGKLLITPEEGCWYITTDTYKLYAYFNGTLGAIGDIADIYGDNVSIDMSDNILKLHGFELAENATFPQIKILTNELGVEIGRALEWISIDNLIQPDGNTKTVLETVENSALILNKEYQADTDTYLYKLDIKLPDVYTKSEVNNLFLTKEEAYDDSAIVSQLENLGNSLSQFYTKAEVNKNFLTKEEAYDDTVLWENLNTLQGELNHVYTKDETYSKEEINTAISNMTHFSVEVVESTEDMVEENVLYLIYDEGVYGNDKYNEYLVIGNVPILIGDTTTNLTNYVTLAELEEHAAAAKALYATKQELNTKADTTLLNEYYTKNEVEGQLDTLLELINSKATQGTTLADYGILDAYTKSETVARTEVYTKTEIDKLLDDGSEAADSVKRALDAYIQNIDTELYGLELVQRWTQDDGTYNPQYLNDPSRLDELSSNVSKVQTVLEGLGTENGPATVLEAIDMARYTLPIATQNILGGIKAAASTIDNGVQINEEGVASVQRVNVKTLVQTEGEELILNGGIA